jgi:hypothetical protein
MSGTGWKRRVALLALFVAAAALILWIFHPRPSDEELLVALVARAEMAVETKDKDGIMACVAEDYRDDAGLDRTDILRLALYWKRSTEHVEVWIDEYEWEITPPTATGRFEVTLEFEHGVIHEPPLRLPLVVEFEKVRRKWRKEWLVTAVRGHGLADTWEGL